MSGQCVLCQTEVLGRGGARESIPCSPRQWGVLGTGLQPLHLLLRPQSRKAPPRTSDLKLNSISVTTGSVSLLKYIPVSSSALCICKSDFISTSEGPGLGSKSHGEESSKKTTKTLPTGIQTTHLPCSHQRIQAYREGLALNTYQKIDGEDLNFDIQGSELKPPSSPFSMLRILLRNLLVAQ